VLVKSPGYIYGNHNHACGGQTGKDSFRLEVVVRDWPGLAPRAQGFGDKPAAMRIDDERERPAAGQVCVTRRIGWVIESGTNSFRVAATVYVLGIVESRCAIRHAHADFAGAGKVCANLRRPAGGREAQVFLEG